MLWTTAAQSVSKNMTCTSVSIVGFSGSASAGLEGEFTSRSSTAASTHSTLNLPRARLLRLTASNDHRRFPPYAPDRLYQFLARRRHAALFGLSGPCSPARGPGVLFAELRRPDRGRGAGDRLGFPSSALPQLVCRGSPGAAASGAKSARRSPQ